MEKICGKCSLPKDVETDFYERADAPGKYRSVCKDCMKKADRKRYSDEEKLAISLRLYSMTPDQYRKMLADQGGVCAICKKPERVRRGGKIKRLCVDHDHRCCPGNRSCGRCVRKLLCDRCNRLVGLSGEDSQLLRAMAGYVDEHSDNNPGTQELPCQISHREPGPPALATSVGVRAT